MRCQNSYLSPVRTKSKAYNRTGVMFSSLHLKLFWDHWWFYAVVRNNTERCYIPPMVISCIKYSIISQPECWYRWYWSTYLTQISPVLHVSVCVFTYMQFYHIGRFFMTWMCFCLGKTNGISPASKKDFLPHMQTMTTLTIFKTYAFIFLIWQDSTFNETWPIY